MNHHSVLREYNKCGTSVEGAAGCYATRTSESSHSSIIARGGTMAIESQTKIGSR